MIGIIFRPLVTEKMTKLGEQSQYAFEVNFHSNKIEILKAVENNKIQVVLGSLNKLKKGPKIVSTNPRIEEMKNLGNLKRFSQKSGI